MINGILFVLLSLISILLVGVILIQRGRGGGLAGAFGGTGGTTAFGTRAGDVFTRITIVVAGIWIFLCMVLVYRLNHGKVSALRAAPGASGSTATGTGTGTDPNPLGIGRDESSGIDLPPIGSDLGKGLPDTKPGPAPVPPPSSPLTTPPGVTPTDDPVTKQP